MKNLLIIGARGFGREVINLAMQCNGYQKLFQIKGFLDDKKNALDAFNSYPPIIDSVENYVVKEDDVFVCGIGDVQQKKKYVQIILDKGGCFISLIHPTALINLTATLGKGLLVFPFAQVGSAAVVGDYVLIQSYAGIAHDVKIGDYSRIDVQVLCVGGVIVGNYVTIHSGAVLNHKVVVEDNAVIGATSFVIRKVKQGTTVFGNPAREI
jgi:sugar O-acyltransferase (sialic acid O-acetyltransferase NeuD family)